MTETAKCFQFYYHMFGANIGTLSVKVKGSSSAEQTLWTKSGNQGSEWAMQKVTIPEIEGMQVIFKFNNHCTTYVHVNSFYIKNTLIRALRSKTYNKNKQRP